MNIAKDLFFTGLKPKDSLHIAAAVIAGCDYFITTDDEIMKKLMNYNRIKIINPAELIINEDF